MIITDKVGFTDAFKYPFKRPKRLLYGLWMLLPIIGWFALSGYLIRVVNEQVEGKYEGLPKLYFMEDLKLGFVMFLKSLPFGFVYTILIVAVLYFGDESAADILSFLLGFFVLPLLNVNFFRKQTIESYFEFSVLKHVVGNLGNYLGVMIKQYLLSLIFIILCFLLVGFPALYVTSSVFVANFYGRLVEEEVIWTLENEPYQAL